MIVGVSDLATTHPEIAKEWDDERDVLTVSYGSNHKVQWRCEADHLFVISVKARTTGKKLRCPYCFGRKPLSGFNDLTITHPDLAAQWSPKNDRSPHEVKAGSHYRAEWICDKNPKHVWDTVVKSRAIAGNKCPLCSGSRVIKGINDLSITHPYFLKEWRDERDMADFSIGSDGSFEWECEKGHLWSTSIWNRVQGKGCYQCWAGQSSSKPEDELFAFIEKEVKSIFPGAIIVRNSRRVIHPSEIDIYVPELNLAFEFNGEYWHSDKGIASRVRGKFKTALDYHQNKLSLCEQIGIKLAFVWDQDWTTDREAVEKQVVTLLRAKGEIEIPPLLSKLEGSFPR